MPFFDILFCIVPGASAGTHRNCHKKAGHDGAHQDAAECSRSQKDANQNRHHNRQDRGHDHFFDRCRGEQVHRFGVLGFGRAFHDALDFTELTPNLFDHRACGTSNRFHRHGAKQVGNQASDEQADNDAFVGKVKTGVQTHALERMGVVGKKHQSRQTGRADCIAFGHRLGGIPHRIKRVGDVTNRLG